MSRAHLSVDARFAIILTIPAGLVAAWAAWSIYALFISTTTLHPILAGLAVIGVGLGTIEACVVAYYAFGWFLFHAVAWALRGR